MASTREPVLVGSAVLWVLAQAGTVVVGHTDLINQDQWSALSSALVPVITTVIIAAIAWVTRSKVSPVAKVAKAVLPLVSAQAVTPPPVVTATDASNDSDVFVATGDPALAA